MNIIEAFQRKRQKVTQFVDGILHHEIDIGLSDKTISYGNQPCLDRDKPPEQQFFVKREEEGVYITHLNTGNQYFLTNGGGCFFIGIEDNDFPFTEAVTIHNQDFINYLLGLIATSNGKALSP